MDLLIDLQNLLDELDECIRAKRKLGEKLAHAEEDYKIALREEVLRERDKGTAVGVINLIIYGEPTVARLRFERDLAETVYETCQDKINVDKLKAKILENQINREYGYEGKQL